MPGRKAWQKYIWCTTQQLRERLCKHLGYIRILNIIQSIGAHKTHQDKQQVLKVLNIWKG